MKTRYILLAVVILFSGRNSPCQYSFTGIIVDEETRLPLSATVSLTSEKGEVLAPEGQHDHVFYLGRKRWYVEGEFSVNSPYETVLVEIRRGLETIPLSQKIDIPDLQARPKEFLLKRWKDMVAMGYLSGDSHIHFLDPQTAHRQMKAEDLNVANLLTSDFTNDSAIFSGALDPVSTERHFVYVGQEIRDWQLGHANFLDLKYIVQPLNPFGGSLFAMGTNPNMLLSPRLEESHRQGAANVWAHFSNLPGLESAVAFSLGLIDAVELITYDDPTMLPSHWTVWDFSEQSPVEFPPMRGMDLYYQHLNTGLQLPITAGTDKMGDNIPVGSNRNYVWTDGEMNYDAWIEGMKKGCGFVTNAPLLDFTVDSHRSGETIRFSGERKVRVRLRAESLLPFGRVEIVANGKTVAFKYRENSSTKRDIFTAEIEMEMTLTGSTWIAGRVTSLDTQEILPRNLTVFAHSNPVYFLRDGKPVYIKASADYLLDYLKSGRNWVKFHSDFATEEEKDQALMYLKKAEKSLKGPRK